MLCYSIQESLDLQFKEHEAHKNTHQPLFKHQRLPPRPIPQASLYNKVSQQVSEWSVYSQRYGEDLGPLISQEVAADGKQWRDLDAVEAQVQLEIVDSLWEDMMTDTFNDLKHLLAN